MLYKVEELLALRDSVSESAVSIDKFADEDVIKGKVDPNFSHRTQLPGLALIYSFPFAARRRAGARCPGN